MIQISHCRKPMLRLPMLPDAHVQLCSRRQLWGMWDMCEVLPLVVNTCPTIDMQLLAAFSTLAFSRRIVQAFCEPVNPQCQNLCNKANR